MSGAKVTAEIPRIRAIPQGQDSISPSRNPASNIAEDLLDAIARVRDVTGKPVVFTAVIGAYGWLDEFCTFIAQRSLGVYDKAERVALHSQRLMQEVETIAHSRGDAEPPLLQRQHCRQVIEGGSSKPLDEFYANITRSS